MFLAIGKFFAAIFKFLLGLITGVLTWARKHPREVVIVGVGGVVSEAGRRRLAASRKASSWGPLNQSSCDINQYAKSLPSRAKKRGWVGALAVHSTR